MAIRVINFFEIINIQHSDTNRLLLSFRQFKNLVSRIKKISPIIETSEIILIGHFMDGIDVFQGLKILIYPAKKFFNQQRLMNKIISPGL